MDFRHTTPIGRVEETERETRRTSRNLLAELIRGSWMGGGSVG